MSVISIGSTDWSLRNTLLSTSKSGEAKYGLSNVSLGIISANHYEPGGYSTSSPNLAGLGMSEVLNRNTGGNDLFRKLIIYCGTFSSITIGSPSAICAYRTSDFSTYTFTNTAGAGTWLYLNAINYTNYTYVQVTNTVDYGKSPRWYNSAGTILSTSATITLYSNTWTSLTNDYLAAGAV